MPLLPVAVTPVLKLKGASKSKVISSAPVIVIEVSATSELVGVELVGVTPQAARIKADKTTVNPV